MFVSGNFDYDNLKMSFYEISDEKKFSNEDINYIEQEFNNLMLEDGYTSLFYFPTFKEFIKSITSESDWFNMAESFFLDLQFYHTL